MKYLVLGGNGQIGSALVRHLLACGHKVTAPQFDYADVGYTGELLGKVTNCDYVFFLAFRAGGARFLKDNQSNYNFISENVSILSNVFWALQTSGVPFLYTSSQMSNMNHSSYGVMKRLAEFYAESLGGVSVKFWNVYGIEKEPEKFHAISDFCAMAKRGHIKMKTTGTEERQFLYADDAARALLTIAQNHEAMRGKPLHVTSFEWVSLAEVALTIAELAGDVTVETASETDSVQFNMRNEPDRFILSYWKPTTHIKDGMRKVLDAI